MPPDVISYCFVSSNIWLDSNTLVVGQNDRSMHFVKMLPDGNFEKKTFMANPTEKFNFPCGNLACMAPHPSGNFFATFCKNNTIILWDALTLQIISTLNLSEALSMSFNSRGNLLIVGCVKKLVIVGVSPNGDNMRILAQNAVHRRYVPAVAIHSFEEGISYILSGSNGGSLVLSEI
jgi:WD40 repeat protein